LAHAQFETIHPFLDGNGRLGRLLITFLLTEKRLLKKPVLYLSHYFKRHRAEYYDRLQAVRDAGDWEGWLEFFLREITGYARNRRFRFEPYLKLFEEGEE
jgi:Fic family protein